MINRLEKHPENLGKIVSNLLTIEFLARLFLAKKLGQEEFPEADAQIGDWVPLNPLTSYDQLEKILKDYNGCVVNKQYEVDVARLRELRHALAHGRILSDREEDNFKLYKFSEPNAESVQIIYLKSMNKQWFEMNLKFINEEILKIMRASSEENLHLTPEKI